MITGSRTKIKKKKNKYIEFTKMKKHKQNLEEVEKALISTKEELENPFPKEEKLNDLLCRQRELDELLSIDDSKMPKEKMLIGKSEAMPRHKARKMV